MPKPMNTPTTIRITLSAPSLFGEAAAGAALAELPPTGAPQEVQKLFPSTNAEPHLVQKFAMEPSWFRKCSYIGTLWPLRSRKCRNATLLVVLCQFGELRGSRNAGSVVVFLAEVGDEVFAHQPTEGVLQLHGLDEEVVLGIEV